MDSDRTHLYVQEGNKHTVGIDVTNLVVYVVYMLSGFVFVAVFTMVVSHFAKRVVGVSHHYLGLNPDRFET